ncbi:hypothetical protein OIO90_000491 [Microbotryomycetes sp. JL221]|nr:hypothetical protein OIO90_000491 [Microbotryomycetes sp. JL221]
MLKGRRNTLLSKQKDDPVHDVYHVGLINLGNSCFYNTVLQALAVSQPLSEIILRAPQSSPALRRLSPASSEYDPDTSTLLSPLPITQALLNLLKSLDLSNDSSRGRKVFNPKTLLRHLSAKHEEYAQATQQDAHEMLRHLIDGVMMEEVDLIKKVRASRKRPAGHPRRMTLRGPIVDDMRTPTAEMPPKTSGTRIESASDGDEESTTSESSDSESSSDEDETELAKRQKTADDLKPFIAEIFDGKLASIVVCNECKHVSRRTEDFMDISLSLRDDAGNKIKRRDRIRKMFGKRTGSPGASSRSNESSANESSSRSYSLSLSEAETSSSASELESDDERKSRSRHGSVDQSRLSAPVKSGWLSGRAASRTRDASPLGINGSRGSITSSATNGSGTSNRRSKKPRIPKPTGEQVAYIRRLLVEIPGLSKDPLPIRIARPPGSSVPSAESSSSSLPALNESMASLRVSPEQMATDLYECLRQFTSVEVLEGENSFACHNCWKLLNPELVEKRKQDKALKRAEKLRKKAAKQARADMEARSAFGEQCSDVVFNPRGTDDIHGEAGPERRGSLAPSDSISNAVSPLASSRASLHSEPSQLSDAISTGGADDDSATFADTEDGNATDASLNDQSSITGDLSREPLTTANIEKLAESADITPSASRAQSVAASVSNASADNTSGLVVNSTALSTSATKSAASGSASGSHKAIPLAPPKARYILRKAHKRYLISAPDLPPVLVIHLKRFQQTNKSSLFGAPFTSLKKRDDDLTFPQELDLAPFLAPTDKPPRQATPGQMQEYVAPPSPLVEEYSVGTARYSLYAVVVHFGTLVTGHYSAYVKSDRYGKGPGGTSDRRWFFCSDEDVRACSLDEVLRSKAYILFYERLMPKSSASPDNVSHEEAGEDGAAQMKSQL